MNRILSRTVSIAFVVFGLIALIGVWRLSNGPTEAITAGSENLAILAIGATSCVLVLGVLAAIIYGVAKLVGKGYRGEEP